MSVAIWGGVGGTPPPEIFWTKNAIFHIFHQNSNSLDYKKFGVGTLSPRGSTPLKFFFYILNSASLMGDVTRMDDVVSVAIWG